MTAGKVGGVRHALHIRSIRLGPQRNGTVAECSCGWVWRSNESLSGKGTPLAQEAHSSHRDCARKAVLEADSG